MAAATVPISVELPTPERVEELLREELRRVAEERAAWFDSKEAAVYVKMAKRTFERKKKLVGLPASKMDGSIAYWRADLDAMRLAHVVTPKGPTVIEFPSVKARAEVIAGDGDKAPIKFPSQAAGAA